MQRYYLFELEICILQDKQRWIMYAIFNTGNKVLEVQILEKGFMYIEIFYKF